MVVVRGHRLSAAPVRVAMVYYRGRGRPSFRNTCCCGGVGVDTHITEVVGGAAHLPEHILAPVIRYDPPCVGRQWRRRMEA